MEPGQVGAKLRDARVARGLSLEDIASTTKVPRSMLLLLETDAYSKMPAPVFVRGFIRSYAKVVGVDANPIVRAYEQRTMGLDHSLARPVEEAPARDTRPGDAPRKNRVGLDTNRKLTPVEPLSEPREGMFRGGYALLAMVAVGLLIAAWLMVGGKRPNNETTSARANDRPALHDGINGVPTLDNPARAGISPSASESPWTTMPSDAFQAPRASEPNDPSVGAPTRSDRPRPSEPSPNRRPSGDDEVPRIP